MPFSDDISSRILSRLSQLYGDDAQSCLDRIDHLACEFCPASLSRRDSLWDERDVVLIAYGDQIRSDRQSPLQTLKSFLTDYELDLAIRLIHLLPFFPYSSDDGFSVIDYRQIDPQLGSWQDVADMGRTFDLMFDQVLNHCSSQNEWFRAYLKGEEPYDGYFIEADPKTGLSSVTRPRSTPVLTECQTSRGARHLWTTFSADQIDLNFANPQVLIEMLALLLFYAEKGARVIRLDAIAYLWKQIGTECIHLPQTHTVVKLMRDVLDAVAPGTILLTETNVPHDENVSYFGNGDEAHMVYQFSLAPLLLDALLSGDARSLSDWLTDLDPPHPETTFFNFTASHDGIGVRPLEGLVPPERLGSLVETVRQRGGLVGTKRNADGSDSPYELNVTYFSALAPSEGAGTATHVRRFLASQAITLALRGIPGVYFHSLVGTPNDVAGFERTGRARSINRRKFDRGELDRILADPASPERLVFDGYRRMLAARVAHPAFHPDASQEVKETKEPSVLALLRRSLDGTQSVLVLANVSDKTVDVDTRRLTDVRFTTDLLNGKDRPPSETTCQLYPYQVAWLSTAPASSPQRDTGI